jgi:hypothetical protein
VLDWSPRMTFKELVEMMSDADLIAVRSGQPFHIDSSLAALLPAVQ